MIHVRERDASNKLGKILRTGHKNIYSILQRMVDRKIAKKIKLLKEKADDTIKNIQTFVELERKDKEKLKKKHLKISELPNKLVKKIFMDL